MSEMPPSPVGMTIGNSAPTGSDGGFVADQTLSKRANVSLLRRSDVEDSRLQAELIRYLQHPRSGAAGFDDMGSSWVRVRDAVAAGTLRATDRKVGAVTTSWDTLVRHLCLRLTSQLGVTVAPVLPRRIARDHQARAQVALSRLADDGILHATLRIRGAIGDIGVTADLRTGQVKTTVEIDAPGEGGGLRRVNWILRQLKDAPDALIVEVVFARREQTSCELLKDVRDNPAALLPDAAAEVRAFRLSLCAPLGTKGRPAPRLHPERQRGC